MHHVRADAGILTEAMHYAGPGNADDKKKKDQEFQTTSRARDLTDLEPKAWRSRSPPCN
jgi:hypothetical protein